MNLSTICTFILFFIRTLNYYHLMFPFLYFQYFTTSLNSFACSIS